MCASGLTCWAINTTGTKANSQSTGLRRISLSKGFMRYDLMGMGTLPLALAVWCMSVERSSAGGLFQPVDLRAVTWRACTLTAATRPVSTIPARPITTASNRDTTCRGVRSP